MSSNDPLPEPPAEPPAGRTVRLFAGSPMARPGPGVPGDGLDGRTSEEEPTAPGDDRPEGIAGFRRAVAASFDDRSWRAGAACREVDPDLFFPAGTTGQALEMVNVAKAICSACPVQAPCLRFAITTNQAYGVWGGCDEDERRRLRRQLRARKAKAQGPRDSSGGAG